MSALTDLFSALANKIRSKTGGQETYTPNEMVQDGIDDVYEAGVAAGTTTHTQTYTPSPNVAANDMGVEHEYRYVDTSGMIEPSGNIPLTQNGTGFDVSNYATASVSVSGTPITPSDSNPPAMTSGTMYTPSANGYAYASQITPASKTETTLWTNPSPTSTFGITEATLSSSIDNFDYIKIKYAATTTYQASANCIECIYSIEDIRKTSISTVGMQLAISVRPTSNTKYNARRMYRMSDTKLSFSPAYQMNGSTTDNNSCIPLSIVGVKFSGITLN